MDDQDKSLSKELDNSNDENKTDFTQVYHRELSSHYYKNRSQLTFYSGLLLAWELIGVTVPSKPFINSNIEIKSPEAFPVVLLVMILYFIYRTTIGWLLSDPKIRSLSVSKFDLNSSFLITFLSIGIYIYQTITEKQLFDINLSTGFSLILIVVVIFFSFLQLLPIYMVIEMLFFHHKGRSQSSSWQPKLFMFLLGPLPTVIIFFYSVAQSRYTLLWINLITTFILLLLTLLIDSVSIRTRRR